LHSTKSVIFSDHYADAIKQAVRSAVINTLTKLSKLAQIKATDKTVELSRSRGSSFVIENQPSGGLPEVKAANSSDLARLQSVYTFYYCEVFPNCEIVYTGL